MSSRFTLQEASENSAQRAALIAALRAPEGWMLREDLSQYTLFIPRADRAALPVGDFTQIVERTMMEYGGKLSIVPVINASGVMGDEVGISCTAYDALTQHARNHETAELEDTKMRALIQQRLFSEKALWNRYEFVYVIKGLDDLDYGARDAEKVRQLIIEAFEGNFGEGEVPAGFKVSVRATARDGRFEIDAALPTSSKKVELKPRDEPDTIVAFPSRDALKKPTLGRE